MKIAQFISFVENEQIKFLDFRFTDIKGQEQHITIPKTQINNNLFQYGKSFEGFSIAGWKTAEKSDMILMPDLSSTIIDPFYHDFTAIVRCNIIDPNNNETKFYDKDPRSIAKKAEVFLKNSRIADTSMFSPELEFFLFDDIRFHTSASGCHLSINDQESSWNNNKIYKHGNKGHRPNPKKGYGIIPPVDTAQNLRSHMALTMEKMGLIVEAHHHAVATSGQNKITTNFSPLTKKADETQIYKYVVRNVANNFGKTATFMPKPILGDNGSSMNCHISLYKDNINLFASNNYDNLSKTALFYIGGILKHSKALNAITNPTTNSYKRLILEKKASTIILSKYSYYNRSSTIRMPLINNKDDEDNNNKSNTCRLEIRFPDPSANPYLAFSALLMAGIDGIVNKIDPGNPIINENRTTLSKSKKIYEINMARSLDEALHCLNKDHKFLIKNNVFTKNFIDSYINLIKQEEKLVNSMPHPIEFELYYSV